MDASGSQTPTKATSALKRANDGSQAMHVKLHLVEDDFINITVIPTSSSIPNEDTSKHSLKYTTQPSKFRSSLRSAGSHDEDYFSFVSSYIDSISDLLRPVSLKIHDNPELNYKEFIAHDTLTKFMGSQEGWKVTPSAFGIETAFVAEYDSGKPGAVISYNAEYGGFNLMRNIERTILKS